MLTVKVYTPKQNGSLRYLYEQNITKVSWMFLTSEFMDVDIIHVSPKFFPNRRRLSGPSMMRTKASISRLSRVSLPLLGHDKIQNT